MRRAYGAFRVGAHHPVHDLTVAGLAVLAGIACWWHDARITFVAALALGTVAGGRRVDGLMTRSLVVFVLLGSGAALRADHAWAQLAPRALGAYDGWVAIVDDPQPFARSTRVIVDVEGERFEVWARGRAFRLRVGDWRAGDQVRVHGLRSALTPERQDRVSWQHVVGELDVEWVTDTAAGSPVSTASNRVRATLERGAAGLPGDDGSLFRGLVVGDDRDQPRAMIERFRASGLSHLTAVSGQNVSFVLMAAAPLLRIMRPWSRWFVTLGLILWFVSLTRFEPSIVRAGAMAALSATAFVLGRERSPARILWLAVTGLLLIDPLLVRSVGFWLSVGATAGVAVAGPWLAARLDRLGLIAVPLGVTLGAQIGVVIPAMLVFGRLPLVSIPANLLAVPVAGFVMLYGLPAGLVAGAIPPTAPVVMFPCRVGVRWVDTVAVLGARVEPGGTVAWLGWSVLAVGVAVIAAMNRGRHGDPSPDG